MDENHNQDALLSFCHVCHRSVGESAFPDVFREIITKPHPAGLSVNANLLFLYCGDHKRNLGDGGGWARKKTHQSYNPINSKKNPGKTTPTSNVVEHRKLSVVKLFLVSEDIVWNEGATQTGRGCGTSWVNKHKWSGGKCGGRLSGTCFLGSTGRYLQALQQSSFTRISTSKIHGSKKCLASGNQTGSHGLKTGM